MPPAKLVFGAAVSALALCACGTVDVKPTGTTTGGVPASRGRIDSPATTKTNHVECIRADKLSVQEIGTTDLLINGSIRVHFDPTPGAAQSDQIRDREQAAEVIGSALLYPGNAPDSELGPIETCLARGVSG
jgi:hypothetical protein